MPHENNEVTEESKKPVVEAPPARWEDLGLSKQLVDLAYAAGFAQPTEIQVRALPFAMEGRDVVASAKTGSGKTASFSFPLIDKLKERRGTLGLVLAPTREIALQTLETLKQFGDPLGVRSIALIGGTDVKTDERAILTYPQVIVGTPGRICDHLERGNLWLEYIEFLVLDEADRMLDMGFAKEVNRIVEQLPKTRQTMLFSATMPMTIEKLSREILYKPERVAVGHSLSVSINIAHEIFWVPEARKRRELIRFLEREPGTAIVFTRTKDECTHLWRSIHAAGIHESTYISSNKSQSHREEALEGFRAGRYRVLVATDVAGRGIHVENVACVVNYGVPDEPEDYIHRVGRTGRKDQLGRAVTFADLSERKAVARIEATLKEKLPQRFSPELERQMRKDSGDDERPRGERPARGGSRRATPEPARRRESERPAPPREAARGRTREDRPRERAPERESSRDRPVEREARRDRPAEREAPRSRAPEREVSREREPRRDREREPQRDRPVEREARYDRAPSRDHREREPEPRQAREERPARAPEPQTLRSRSIARDAKYDRPRDREVSSERPARDVRPVEREARYDRPERNDRRDRPVEREPRNERPARERAPERERASREDRPRERSARGDRPPEQELAPREERPRGRERSEREDLPRDRERAPREAAPRDRERTPREAAPRDRERAPREAAPRDRERAPREAAPRDRERAPREAAPRDRERAPREAAPRDRERAPREAAPRDRERAPREAAPRDRERAPREAAPRDRERAPREAAPRDRERAPREAAPRDRERAPREAAPRDRERAPREAAPRDRERAPREATPRDRERAPREAAPRDRERAPREAAPRDRERAPREAAPRDRERAPREAAPRDGERSREEYPRERSVREERPRERERAPREAAPRDRDAEPKRDRFQKELPKRGGWLDRLGLRDGEVEAPPRAARTERVYDRDPRDEHYERPRDGEPARTVDAPAPRVREEAHGRVASADVAPREGGEEGGRRRRRRGGRGRKRATGETGESESRTDAEPQDVEERELAPLVLDVDSGGVVDEGGDEPLIVAPEWMRHQDEEDMRHGGGAREERELKPELPEEKRSHHAAWEQARAKQLRSAGSGRGRTGGKGGGKSGGKGRKPR